MEVRNVELLVGGVQIVVRQTEAHHHAGNLKHILKIGHDWNRAAGANEDRVFLKHFVHGFGGGLYKFIVGANHAGWTFTPHFDFGFDALGRELFHEGGVALEDVVWILVWNHAHG